MVTLRQYENRLDRLEIQFQFLRHAVGEMSSAAVKRFFKSKSEAFQLSLYRIDDVCNAIATIRARLPRAELWVPPTVVEELAHAAGTSPSHEVRRAAVKILGEHGALAIRLINFIPLGFDRVEQIAQRLRRCGLLPEEEVHDSMVLAEAAALGCALLTSRDDDLRSVDHAKLAVELAKFDLAAPVIATLREIVRKFFR